MQIRVKRNVNEFDMSNEPSGLMSFALSCDLKINIKEIYFEHNEHELNES